MNMSQQAGTDGIRDADLNDAALIRAHADGELSAEQAARVPADSEDRVAFERELKTAVGRVAETDASVQASPALRARIETLVAEARSWTDDEQANSGAGTADTATIGGPATRDRGFWSGSAAGSIVRFGSIAAVLVLALVVAFQAGRSAPLTPAQQQGVTYVAEEHSECDFSSDARDGKFSVVDAASLPGALNRIVGTDVSMGEILAGLEDGSVEFADAGACAVPGGKSMHLRIRVPSEQGSLSLVSLFVQADTGTLDLQPDATYRLRRGTGGEPCVFAWRGDGVVFWLVCDGSQAPDVRKALGAPSANGRL
ncbi:MAG: hypothetical protein AAF747_05435 [Planctomycetota bacterium]